MQADRRLIQHEQGVGERGAERRGEVDALHFAARQRARLAVEREIAEAHLSEVIQARADLLEQQLRGLIERRRQRQRAQERGRALDRQAHQLVNIEAWHTGITRGDIGAADPPQQGIGLQARAVAGRALGVGPVLRQQHADVHLVALGLEPLEEARHPVPDAIIPVTFAFEHPALVLLAQCGPRYVGRHPALAGEAHQVALAFDIRGGLPWLYRALGQRLALIRNHQRIVDADHAPEPAAGGTGADRRVEREQARRRIGIVNIAIRAVQIRGVAPGGERRARLVERIDRHAPAPVAERRLDVVAEPAAVFRA